MKYALLKIENGCLAMTGYTNKTDAVKQIQTDMNACNASGNVIDSEYRETTKEVFARVEYKNRKMTTWHIYPVTMLTMSLPAANKNEFAVSYGCDAAYPGVDIEYISAQEDNMCTKTRPRVLFEQEQNDTLGEELNIRIWNDPDTEDYTDKICMRANYYQHTENTEKGD